MTEPGAWLGLLGGGQLGRMFVHAAQRLGYKVVVLDPEKNGPAAQVADDAIAKDYSDQRAIDDLLWRCQAVTTEFENVPAETLKTLAAHLPVRPGAAAVAIAQDRREEKRFCLTHRLPIGRFAVIEQELDVAQIDPSIFPAILKTARFGYDGKGQQSVRNSAELRAAWIGLERVPCVLEQRQSLALELSVLIARNAQGQTALWPVQENQHVDGVLDLSFAPARIEPGLALRACGIARLAAEALRYEGVLCVELFLTQKGELLVNEFAPRPHNSGHYTIDACVTSQFEQQVRVLCDLPLGDTRQHSAAVMVNLLGDVWHAPSGGALPAFGELLGIPGAHLHLYGKKDPRRGRKMGHVTCVAEDINTATQRALEVKRVLGIR